MTYVAVLFTNFGPYHLARIEAAHEYCLTRAWKVVGIELARAETEYAWRVEVGKVPFPIISVTTSQLEDINFTHLLWKLYKLLFEVQPDIVAIAGYARPAMLASLLWCRKNNKPVILFSATTEQDFPRSAWREIVKRWVISQYSSALVAGNPHKRYLVKLGMPSEAISLGYDVVGNSSFHPKIIRQLPSSLTKPYFLAVNRFIPKKNLSFLIAAFHIYQQITGDEAWDLVLCGDGELRSQLEQQISELNLQRSVHLPGFLQQDELLPYFAHAASFIHASIQEQWGLVVNEAMAAGLPVLVSNRCGCFEDLVIDGVTGFGFDPEDQQQLTNLMLKVSSKDFELEPMGKAALAHIQKFSPDYFAEGLFRAAQYALNHSKKSHKS